MFTKYEMREFAKMVAKELAKHLTAKQEQTPDELLTTKEAAAFLKISVHTLHKTKNAYPHRKVGKRLMFPRNGLVRTINN
jgi:hypothetical protein